MFINTFQYKPDEAYCQLCAQYAGKRRGCKLKVCPWLAERSEAGGDPQAVMETLPANPHLEKRLNTAIHRFSGSVFFDTEHERRMEAVRTGMGDHPRRDKPACLAAIYLLTANPDLYQRAGDCFRRHGIEFPCATLKGISPHDYTLFSAARDIYADTSGVALSDLSNVEVTDTLAFSLITNALLIARYGCAVLAMKERRKS